MRLLPSVIVLLAFVTHVFPVLPAAAQGADEQSYQQAVSALQRAGIIEQGPLVDLRLNDWIQRSEVLKVLLKSQPTLASSLSNIATHLPLMSLFPDVDQRSWYAPYVELAFRQRWIQGYPDGLLRPESAVTTEEAAAMLMRSFADVPSSVPFTTGPDLPNIEGQWYTGMISTLHAKNAVRAGSQLKIGRGLTRGQFFDMVAAMQRAHGGVTQVAPIQTNEIPQPRGQTFIEGQRQNQGTMQIVEDAAALQYASTQPFALSIPSLKITDLRITHPEDPFTQDGVLSVLKDGVGHLFSYPGEQGKILIYGHSSGYPWDLSKYTKIFRGINKISVGAHIYVTYKGTLFVYQVSEKKTIPAKDRSAFESAENKEELILYTCWPPDSITQRYLVHAVPVETIALK